MHQYWFRHIYQTHNSFLHIFACKFFLMSDISAVIITYNEEANIERCIKSLLPVASEIVVVDSFSTDRTEEICNRLGARFFKNRFEGYGPQKQFATSLASNRWILSLDADEVVSAEMAHSIKNIKNIDDYAAYSFNRQNFYCGKRIRFCGWYPDTKVRLFDRQQISWNNKLVHESVCCKDSSTVKHLRGDILHYTYQSVEQHEEKARKYALLAAKELGGKRYSALKIYAKAAFRFFRIYVLKLGFLDGSLGFRLSLTGAKFVYWKYSNSDKL